MSNRFVPKMESLEGREVPASLSFQLSDGSIGSALFSTPDGVDPEESSQALDLTTWW